MFLGTIPICIKVESFLLQFVLGNFTILLAYSSTEPMKICSSLCMYMKELFCVSCFNKMIGLFKMDLPYLQWHYLIYVYMPELLPHNVNPLNPTSPYTGLRTCILHTRRSGVPASAIMCQNLMSRWSGSGSQIQMQTVLFTPEDLR